MTPTSRVLSAAFLALASATLASACGSSADSTDSPDVGANGGRADAASRRACHFTKKSYTICPDFSLPPDSTVECIDDLDCATLNGSDSIIAGCEDSTLYLDKVQIDGTCADWRAPDAGADARRPDASGSYPDTGSSNACMPLDVSRFVPTWHPPRPKHDASCGTTGIQGIYDDCFGPSATAQTCQTGAAGPCGACIFSKLDDSEWGPIVDVGSTFSILNVAGCVALLSPGDLACPHELQASDECEITACAHCADGTTSGTAREKQCEAIVDAHQCSAYLRPPACAAEADGGAAAACLAFTDFESAYRVVANAFCRP